MATSISFQGVTTGLQTDALISAIIAQDGLFLTRLKDRQTTNTQRSSALVTMRNNLSSLTISMAQLFDKLNSRAVTSNDSTNTYVTATAAGAQNNSYEVSVTSVATKGQLKSSLDPATHLPTNLAVADPNAAILTSTEGSFAVRGTDGVIKAFKLTTNSLYGLRDAINGSGAGVTASVINTGSGANPYQLVITANKSGTGSTSGVVTLAAINNEDTGHTATTVISSLGITPGTIGGTIASPTSLSDGLSSTADNGNATDAVFTVNGVQVTRSSNTVTDVVDGVTFNLKKGSTSNSTTLTVAQDKATATAGMQDLISKYNAMLTAYKGATTVTRDSSGEITKGPLAGDNVARSVINQVRAVMGGSPQGIPSSALYKSMAELGIKTGSDGQLSLDTLTFQNALDKDPDAVKKVFSFSGTTTNGSVTFKGGSSATATGEVGFDLTYATGGAVTGSLIYNGTTYSGLSGMGGVLSGTAGTPLEGLSLTVAGSASGTITISRGIGQQLQDLISSLTSYSGTIEKTRSLIDDQNKNLTHQIENGQSTLDRRQALLKAQFDKMEAAVAQMRANAGSLSGLG